MEYAYCINRLNKLSQILIHAQKHIRVISSAKGLRLTEITYDQLTRETQSKINDLRINVSSVSGLSNKEAILSRIDDLCEKFSQFDIEITSSVKKKSYKDILKDYILNHDDDDDDDDDFLSILNDSKIPMLNPFNVKGIISNLIQKKKQRKFERRFKRAQKYIDSFRNVTSEFRLTCQGLYEIYDTLYNDINALKKNLLINPSIDSPETDDENLFTNDCGMETTIRKRGPKPKTWAKGELEKFNEEEIKWVLLELNAKTNDLPFTEVSNIRKEHQYDNIWAAIVFYSAQIIGYVDPDDKPGQPFETSIKAIDNIEASRNSISDYYKYIKYFFDIKQDRIREKLEQKLSKDEIKYIAKYIYKETQMSSQKIEFFCLNIKQIAYKIEQITDELKNIVNKKLELKEIF